MANKRSRSRKSSNSRTKSRRRKQHGGDSAWESVMKAVGDGPTQFTNSLMLHPSQNLSTSKSNDIVSVDNINAQNGQPIYKQMAGGNRRKGKSKSAKGGSWEAVAAQALVPGFLLGAQQLYGRRLKSRRHSRR